MPVCLRSGKCSFLRRFLSCRSMVIFRAFPGRDGNPVLCPLPRPFFIRATLLMLSDSCSSRSATAPLEAIRKIGCCEKRLSSVPTQSRPTSARRRRTGTPVSRRFSAERPAKRGLGRAKTSRASSPILPPELLSLDTQRMDAACYSPAWLPNSSACLPSEVSNWIATPDRRSPSRSSRVTWPRYS